MSAQDEFDKLPDWLQKLRELAPNIARKTEAELASMRSRIAELEDQAVSKDELEMLRVEIKGCDEYYDRLEDLQLIVGCSINDLPERVKALKASVAELEAQAAPDYWRKQYDYLASAVADLYEFEPLEEAQPATLTPRQCNRSCFERGFEAGREAAFNAVDNYEIDVESPLFDAFVRRDLEIMTIIESLTAPSSCGCNPLKPSESDAAMLDEWHKRM